MPDDIKDAQDMLDETIQSPEEAADSPSVVEMSDNAHESSSDTQDQSNPLVEAIEKAEKEESQTEAQMEGTEEADQAPEAPSEEVVEEAEEISDHEKPSEDVTEPSENMEETDEESSEDQPIELTDDNSNPNAKWYVVHTYSGHENRVAQTLKQRVESEHLENKILQILVPTQDKIEIKGGKKGTVKEKIFPGYMLVKMELDDQSWLAVRTTQGVTSFIGMGTKPTPISETEVRSILKFMHQGGQPTYKTVYNMGDTVKITEGPFTDFIGKVDNVDKDKGKVRVLVSIFGRETPVELDFLQVSKL